ncbi:ribosomal-protein-alanine acetyltransferase [Leucobacter sp. Psy1]|uniref:ribosomal protein S18-alanine N-acetyltransferase n=1 Tax=Leucobacter sp. Psy1 TaxID=2875729 RepID=UPI00351CD944|nr:ribosomal-protein-alanine acetyltransferase [Leucobacter sp. Psy1]
MNPSSGREAGAPPEFREHPGTLRPVGPADFDAIHAIEVATFGTDAWSAATLADELAGPHRSYVVLEVDGSVRGYAGLLAVGSQGDIQTIAVDASLRGTGQGRRLMDALIARAEQRGVRELFLEVRADNPVAKRLYASLGFVPIAERRAYYQPDGVDAIIMRRDTGEAPVNG